MAIIPSYNMPVMWGDIYQYQQSLLQYACYVGDMCINANNASYNMPVMWEDIYQYQQSLL